MERFVTINIVPLSILFILVGVQAQGLFPSNHSSPKNNTSFIPEFEFPQISKETQSDSQNSSLEFDFPQDPNELIDLEFPIENVSNAEIQPAPLSPTMPFNLSTKTPMPPLIMRPGPCTTKHPWPTDNSCVTRCSTLCETHKIPFLNDLCNEICRRRCILYFSQMIFNCTVHCSYSMPKVCKSDKKKEAQYVGYCYHKCIKK